jgi:hypothetical protein
MNTYDYGSTITLGANFALASGTPADPQTVTLRYLSPTNIPGVGQETIINQAQMQHVSQGAFTYTLTVLMVGVWYYRFEGLGGCNAVQDGVFCVASTPFSDAAG